VINAIRDHLAELVIIAPIGRNGVEELLRVVADARDGRIREVARRQRIAARLWLLKIKNKLICLAAGATDHHQLPCLSFAVGQYRIAMVGYPIKDVRFACTANAFHT
jgi:hypothetical protein